MEKSITHNMQQYTMNIKEKNIKQTNYELKHKPDPFN